MLENVKDSGPNLELISSLERLLSEAKAGQLRSLFYVVAYDDRKLSNGWVYDSRSDTKGMLAEMMLAQQDWIANILITEDRSVLSDAIKN